MAENHRGRKSTANWYTIKQQRVKYANLSVEKDGVYERPGPSWTTDKITGLRARQAEPWNVENVKITGNGVEVFQYGDPYRHNNSKKGPVVLTRDMVAWSVLFKPGSMKDIRVREWKLLANPKGRQLSTFIELCFRYEGLPESNDATQLKTEQPEEAVEGTAEAEGAEVDEGEVNEEGEEVEGEEAEGEEGEGEDGEGEEGEEGEIEDGEADEEMEDKPPAADQFDLAKLFTEPMDFKVLGVRIAFLRTPAKSRPYQWQWPAVFAFLRGIEGWTPQSKKPETEYRVGLPLDDWIKKFGNKHNEVFIAQPKEDKTTAWLMKSGLGRQQQQQQRPSHAGTAVPAFGAPLPKAPQLPSQPTSTPAPTPSGPIKGSKKRTFEEIDAEEEELEREEQRLAARLAARRKELREERRQLYQG